MISNRFALTLATAAQLFANSAAATVMPIPSDRPVATVDIPESWRPTPAERGVEGVALGGAVHLDVVFISPMDTDAASAVAMSGLAERHVVAKPATKRVGARRFSGFEALKVDFDGVDANGDCEISLILIALPRKSGFVGIAYWGDDEAQESVSNDIQSIADSVEIVK